jgi:poly-gamma-glutamate synthesis protein (capsule biosynthesis protein)
MRAVLVALVVAAGIAAAAAEAKLVPRLDRSSAAVGERVTVRLSPTSGYALPVYLDLLPADAAAEVGSRRDPRVVALVTIRKRTYAETRASFTVPDVAPGSYVLALWFKGFATHRWSNALAGLVDDATFGPGITLRVRAAVPFTASVAPVRALGRSWHRGCPVAPRELRLVTLTYWGFDARAHTGQLVVHRDVATSVTRVFRTLYALRFPIRRMQPVDHFGADDDRSMAADNTSAFNCRFVEGTARWSEHAYGRAIDVNPVENPFVSGTHVSPARGRRFADRSLRAPGMIHAGDEVVRTFASVGWGWGGNWRSPKDYQHFSATGR